MTAPEPDFTKLPDPPEPMDPHERGVMVILILLAILSGVMLYSVFQTGAVSF